MYNLYNLNILIKKFNYYFEKGGKKMSHFTVGVISRPDQDIDEMLAPYSENLEVEPYIDVSKTEVIENARKRKEEFLEKINNGDTSILKYAQKHISANTDEELYKAECEYWDYTNFDENGNVLSTYNPQSKWDWYQVGGRWGGSLKLKKESIMNYFNEEELSDEQKEYLETNGFCSDSAYIKDIDFSPDPQKYEEYKRFYEVVVDGAPLKDGEKKEEFETFYRPSYLKETYKNADTYAKVMTSFSCYAMLTDDGVWHGKGDMGWFGMSSETGEESVNWDLTMKERFIDTANQDYVLTIVDCHI
jgi:hypothetical protein